MGRNLFERGIINRDALVANLLEETPPEIGDLFERMAQAYGAVDTRPAESAFNEWLNGLLER